MPAQILDKTVFPKEPASLKAVLAKTAADQLIWAPVMTCVFFAVLKTLEGHPEMIMSTIEVRREGRLRPCTPPCHVVSTSSRLVELLSHVLARRVPVPIDSFGCLATCELQ